MGVMQFASTWRGEGEEYFAEVRRRARAWDSSPWPGDPTIWLREAGRVRHWRLSRAMRLPASLARLLRTATIHLAGGNSMRQMLKDAYAAIGAALAAERAGDDAVALGQAERAAAALNTLLEDYARSLHEGKDEEDEDEEDEDEEDEEE